jgi:Flp pilus assembly protein TadD
MQRALEKGPLSAALLLLAARLENTAKDPQAAEKYLRQAIDLEPDDISAYTMLGQMYVRQNRLDAAKHELEEVTRRRPENVSARTMIGIILDAQGKFEESQKIYEAILASTSRAPVAANNLAYIYAERGDRLNEALSLAQRAKEQMPDSHEINDTLGWIYYKKDMANLAVRPLETSVSLDPQNPIYHFHLGLAYAKTGDTAKARKSLEEALKLRADFAGATEARAALASLKD